MSVAGQVQAESRPEQAVPQPHSLLLVDCGSVYTKVALVERVDGRFRLLARVSVPTTASAPGADIWVGISDAVEQLERIVGRKLRDGDHLIVPGRADGTGVGALVAAMSAGGPLRLLTFGPGRDASATLLYRALGGLFVQVDTLPDGSEDPDAWLHLVRRVRETHPDGLLFVGSATGGPSSSSENAWLDALRTVPQQELQALHGLPVLYAGAPAEGTLLNDALRPLGVVVIQVPALAPAATGTVTRAVSSVYEMVVLRHIPGYGALRGILGSPTVPAMTALGGVVRYLSRQYSVTVAGVDVGANATAIAASTAQGEFLPAALPSVGVGPGAGALLRAAGSERVLRWLPFLAREHDLRDYVVSRMVDPWRIPLDERELEIEHALAREAIRLALAAPGARLAGLSPLDVVLCTGGVFANVPHPAMAALMLLDAMEPLGITSLVIDVAQLAPMLGTAAAVSPVAAAELAETDAVPLLLGSVVSAAGPTPAGEPMVRVVLDFVDGRQLVREVVSGSIERLPMAAGERALLSLYPAPQVDVGLGPGQQARASEPLEGGILGLVVDARGRPIRLPQGATERIERLREWRRALGLDA